MNSCNDLVIAETIAKTGEPKALIEHVLHFTHNFIGQKIEEGGFEGVRLPKFGAFQAKHKSVQWRDFMKALPPNYRTLIRKR